MRWPGVIPPGSVCEALVGQVDLMATLAAITGCSLPETAAPDSYDLTPLLRGEVPDPPIRTAHVHNTFEKHYAIRQGDWVLIDARSGYKSKAPKWFDEMNGYEPNPHEQALYNLREDIAQRTNRIEEFPEKAAAMKQLLKQIQQQGQRFSKIQSR